MVVTSLEVGGVYRHIGYNREFMYGGETAEPPVVAVFSDFYSRGETVVPVSSSVTTFTGLATYLRHLPDDPMIQAVSFAVENGSLWIVTEVEAGGSLDRLDGVFEAEASARQASDVALVFRIVDRSIGETLDEGPRNLTPIRK